MKCKICGLFEPSNIIAVSKLMPDYMGFIFYPSSPRYVQIGSILSIRNKIPKSIKTVGVFVDEDASVVYEIINDALLDAVQLHGESASEVVEHLREYGFKGEVLLATTVENCPELKKIHNVDYLVFDTPTPLYGGSGVSFDWSKLSAYQGNIPFFLSGGIGQHNIKDAILFRHPKYMGIDMNSRLECPDKTKDINKVSYCIEQVRNHES